MIYPNYQIPVLSLLAFNFHFRLFRFTAQERKVAYMVFWISITCFVSWMPLTIVYCLRITPAYPSPLLNAIAHDILHSSLILHALINLFYRRDLTNLCLRFRNTSKHAEMANIHPLSLVSNPHAQIK